MKPTDRPLCPSAPLTSKAQLFGVVTGGGQIAYLDKAVVVDARFIEDANLGREPERRFRFAAPCASVGCSNWNNGCTLPERVASDLGTMDEDREVPECSIRTRCVWYRQSGALACRVCRFVVTKSDEF
jgi:hypothetical protein